MGCAVVITLPIMLWLVCMLLLFYPMWIVEEKIVLDQDNLIKDSQAFFNLSQDTTQRFWSASDSQIPNSFSKLGDVDFILDYKGVSGTIRIKVVSGFGRMGFILVPNPDNVPLSGLAKLDAHEIINKNLLKYNESEGNRAAGTY